MRPETPPTGGTVKTSGRPHPVDELAALLFEGFATFLAPRNSIQSALLAALNWAPIEREEGTIERSATARDRAEKPQHAGEVVVIDKAALFQGILAAGQESKEDLSSAAWLVEWLKSRSGFRMPLARPAQNTRNRSAIADGMPVIASRSLRERVLPAAVELARTTVGRDRADMRHLIFALLDEPPATLGEFESLPAGDALTELKNWLAQRITTLPEPTESVSAWRKIASGPGPVESVGTLSDAPALVDALGRKAFSDVLAARIKQVSESLRAVGAGEDRTFILHLDGPWGSGKTSVLNFLKQDLESSDPPWLVVQFNAWRNQDRKPAWWPLVAAVGSTVRQQSWRRHFVARWVWFSWNLRMRWVPVLLSAVLMSAFIYFALKAGSETAPAPASGGRTVPPAQAFSDLLEKSWHAVLALFALGGLVWTGSRSLFLGSKSAAEAYVQSSAEPFRAIVKLFERLVRAVGRPVAIFIDDLDRCDGTYVIELLEGIQTLLRSAPAIYVVAGDRKWICSSFEKRYADFCGQIGAPGRPLGHLFLDKVFQLSTAIPRLSSARQQEYWRSLLEARNQGRHAHGADGALEAATQSELEGKTSYEELQESINGARDPLERERLRAAAARQITTPEATRAAEHRLQPLSGLLEPNPRAMKRLVNAYGLNQARAFLEGRTVDVEALARWTIVELRWPVLSDYLAENWTDIDRGTLGTDGHPAHIRALLADADVRAVFGELGEKGRLTKDSLRPVLEESASDAAV
jgi:KAP family P-loop domain